MALMSPGPADDGRRALRSPGGLYSTRDDAFVGDATSSPSMSSATDLSPIGAVPPDLYMRVFHSNRFSNGGSKPYSYPEKVSHTRILAGPPTLVVSVRATGETRGRRGG